MRVPLAGAVTGEWLRCYQKLAQATKVPVQAQARHDGAWIVGSVPAGSDQVEVVATMDAARALIAEAELLLSGRPQLRRWRPVSAIGGLAGGETLPRRPVPGIVAAGEGAEKRWPMAVTLVLAMAVPLVLPARFSLGPRWAVPVVEVLLLIAIIATDRGHIDRRSAAGRALSLVLVAVLVADAAGVTGRLIADLIKAARRRIRRRIFSRPAFWSGSTRSLPLPSSIGRWTEAVPNRVSWLRRSSPTSPSPPSSIRG